MTDPLGGTEPPDLLLYPGIASTPKKLRPADNIPDNITAQPGDAFALAAATADGEAGCRNNPVGNAAER